MSDLQHEPEARTGESGTGLFSAPPAEPPQRSFLLLLAGAAVAVVLIVALILMRGRAPGQGGALNTELPADPYATHLAFTQLAMSQSTSLSGGTSTFIDGHVRNTGGRTLTGLTMQVLFRNDEGLAPRVETLPLALIRTHEPYVDTEPVSAAPLKPGDEAEFRLIFESIPANWNQQLPELRAVKATLR